MVERQREGTGTAVLPAAMMAYTGATHLSERGYQRAQRKVMSHIALYVDTHSFPGHVKAKRCEQWRAGILVLLKVGQDANCNAMRAVRAACGSAVPMQCDAMRCDVRRGCANGEAWPVPADTRS